MVRRFCFTCSRGKIKDAVLSCESACARLRRALLNKRLRATRVDKAHFVRSADAGSSWGVGNPPHPHARKRAFVYASKRESRFLGLHRSLLKLINKARLLCERVPLKSTSASATDNHTPLKDTKHNRNRHKHKHKHPKIRYAPTMSAPLPPEDKLDTLILCILDGWGIGQGDMEATGDAIRLASSIGNTPNWDKLTKESLTSQLQTSGESVGLPKGQMGNSEVGHTHIGAGRVVKQSLTRINEAIESGAFFKNKGLEAFVAEFKKKEKQGVVHVAGIVSSGGVHGLDKHVLATLKFFHERKLQVRLHAFLDGRDTKPQAAIEELPRFLEECEKIGLGEDLLASVVGRYYAMDRNYRLDRTELAFRAMVGVEEPVSGSLGEVERIGRSRGEVEDALKRSYARNKGDEFVLPFVCGGYEGFVEGDALFFTNFREDRIKQLMELSVAKDWEISFLSGEFPIPYPLGSMTPYEEYLIPNDFHVAFKRELIDDSLGEWVSKAGRMQLHIAETEKIPHVTYFFNGGRYRQFAGEHTRSVPSPKFRMTYDEDPEMSAREVKNSFCTNFKEQNYSLIVLNYANPDMVGHTGDLEATKKAIKVVDECLGEMIDKIRESPKKAGLMVFADHGNAEQMRDENGKPHTAHTTNPVPLVVVGSPSAKLTKDFFKLSNGKLTDIAPTALYLLGLEKPVVMTGRSLLTKKTTPKK